VQTGNAAEEDWDLLVSFFPANWRLLARLSGALKGLRHDKSEENLLRVLMLHVGCGFSMREQLSEPSKPNWLNYQQWRSLSGFAKSKDLALPALLRAL
jgi:hypothetical protein